MLDKLVLKVNASFLGVVGYGYVYKCRVVRIMSGRLDEETITITILAGDKSKLDFIASHLGTVEFLIAFRKKRDNELYSMTPISGFVDKKRTSWEIEYMRDNNKLT